MNQKGFTLFEVMLALSLISIALLTTLHGLIQSQSFEQANKWQAIALSETEFAVNLIKAGDCEQFLPVWKKSIAQSLPQGQAKVSCMGSKNYVQVSWRDKLSQATLHSTYQWQT
jgi:prepilin-type N-terminal cleavage/methylation domain-containing protein